MSNQSVLPKTITNHTFEGNQEGTLLQFPCDFPIKVIGKNQNNFASTIAELVRTHFSDYDSSAMEIRTSNANHYLSLTVTVRAENKAQLDALYRALTAHPMISWVI
ncbi:MAG: DUF493 domain-containing protein [Burkholderiales bacterium]|jgi:putative lipoic acid-binding regulatory protein|nr:DUF493 domain-containing protein [Burkholderiales bacterium]